MIDIINKHIELFGSSPNIIGKYWSDAEALKKAISKSIKDNKPYNEYEMLTKEEQKAFDKGELLF